MKQVRRYKTPGGFDDLLMSSDGESLTGLWFEGSRDENKHDAGVIQEERQGCEGLKDLAVFSETADWLDAYFSGKPLSKAPKLKITGLTPFREEVFEIMSAIPFGKTMTYGEIAEKIARRRGIDRMSSQAVGGAVGWNPVCIIIPCHRVVGAGGALVGYGGGIENKRLLLEHEKHFG